MYLVEAGVSGGATRSGDCGRLNHILPALPLDGRRIFVVSFCYLIYIEYVNSVTSVTEYVDTILFFINAIETCSITKSVYRIQHLLLLSHLFSV